jgi:hypothetical protein
VSDRPPDSDTVELTKPSAEASPIAAPAKPRRWRPEAGRWDLAVEPRWVVTAGLITTLAMVVVVAFDAWPEDRAIVWIPLLTVLCTWGLARGLGARSRPDEPDDPPVGSAGFWRTVLIWAVVVFLARRAWLSLVPDTFALGIFERLLLAAPLTAFGWSLRRRFGLTPGFSALIGLYVFGTFFFTSHVGDNDARRVIAAAGVTQLQNAAKSGEPVLLRSSDEQLLDRTYPPAQAFAKRVAAATTCRSVRGYSQRRTAVGLRGLAIAIRADVCWEEAGRPVEAIVDVQRDPNFDVSGVRPVRFEERTALDAVSRIGDDGKLFSDSFSQGSYDDFGKPLRDQALWHAVDGTAVFDQDGRPRGWDDHHGRGYTGDPDDAVAADGSMDPSIDQPAFPLDTTTMTVSRDGRTVSFVYALESVDPAVGTAYKHPDSGTTDDESADRLFTLRARPGQAYDVFSVIVTRSGTSQVQHLRITSHGARRQGRMAPP